MCVRRPKFKGTVCCCQLALKLMDVFFTKELSAGNCTETEGRELLRQDDIDGIRCKSLSQAPHDDTRIRAKEVKKKICN